MPQFVYFSCQCFFFLVAILYVLPYTQQTLHKEATFYQVATVIFCSERFHFARRTMEPMRPHSMKTIGFCQIVYNLCQPGYTFFPVDKVSFDSHQQAGNSKSATSNRNYILVLLWINVIKMYTFAGQSGSLFRTFPHIVEMRLLNIVE